MAVRLRPMTDDEFSRYREDATVAYVDDLVSNGGMPAEQARRKAAADDASLLPDGLATPNQFLYVVADEDNGRRVGVLWFGDREEGGTRTAFLYDIEIDVAERGRGHGRAAMAAFEAEARRRGYPHLRLNVFAGNEAARRLYRSLGYREQSVIMAKTL